MICQRLRLLVSSGTKTRTQVQFNCSMTIKISSKTASFHIQVRRQSWKTLRQPALPEEPCSWVSAVTNPTSPKLEALSQTKDLTKPTHTTCCEESWQRQCSLQFKTSAVRLRRGLDSSRSPTPVGAPARGAYTQSFQVLPFREG